MSNKKRSFISFFSGAMGLDLGLEKAGLQPALALESDKWACATIRKNATRIPVLEQDIRAISGNEVRKMSGLEDSDVFLLAGGPPCQSFSTGGNRSGLSDTRGNTIFEYFRLIHELKPQYFIFENVANLITAALKHRPIKDRPGKNWNLSAYSKGSSSSPQLDQSPPMLPEELSGSAFRYLLTEIESLSYSISFGILNAADFGAPQKRLRFIMIGARDYPAPALPHETHSEQGETLAPYVTLKDSISDLVQDPGAHSSYTERMAKFFALIPPGGNWRSLSGDYQREVLGGAYHTGGGKTGFMRRLSWDAPAPTLTTKPNRKGSSLCHPEAIRPLSVREYARIQGFPDHWEFQGAMNQQYKQIGNAVPVALGTAIGSCIVQHDQEHRGTPKNPLATTQERLEEMLEVATQKLRASARNRRKKNPSQLKLAL